jgi:hypothetical protein
MGWTHNVQGLTRLSSEHVFSVHEEDPDNWEHASPDFMCPIDNAGSFTACKSVAFSAHSWDRSIAALGATAVVADYYTVTVQFTSPGNFERGSDECGNPTLALGLGCGPKLPVLINANLTGDSYLTSGNSLTGSPVSLETAGGSENNTTWRFEHPASVSDGGYLENLDPVWPAPDADGNTFGRVLFTRAQMLALPDITFYTEAWDHAGPGFDLFGQYTFPGRTRIGITPYNLISPPIPTSSMCIVDYA